MKKIQSLLVSAALACRQCRAGHHDSVQPEMLYRQACNAASATRVHHRFGRIRELP
jgi:hypothetical protein